MDISVDFLLYSVLNTTYNTVNVHSLQNFSDIFHIVLQHVLIFQSKTIYYNISIFVTPVSESQRPVGRLGDQIQLDLAEN